LGRVVQVTGYSRNAPGHCKEAPPQPRRQPKKTGNEKEMKRGPALFSYPFSYPLFLPLFLLALRPLFLPFLTAPESKKSPYPSPLSVSVAVYSYWGICSITQKKKSVAGCSIPNRFSLAAT